MVPGLLLPAGISSPADFVGGLVTVNGFVPNSAHDIKRIMHVNMVGITLM